MNRLTVNQAISKGHKWVNYPIFGIMLLGFGLTIYLMIIVKNAWIFPIGFVFTFVLMWFWWSFVITKWRIWAFGNCRNVHELKRKAINEKLIWPDGSRFEKTEIRTNWQREQLNIINKKFEKQDEIEILEDDNSIPNETRIYYSKISLAIYWVSGICLFLYGIYMSIEGDLFGYILLIISGFSIFYASNKSKQTDPYIVMNSKGIQTLNTSFTAWENIQLIQTERRGSGKYAKWHLDIEFKNQNSNGDWGDDIEISDLSESPKKIEKMISIYKQRNRKSNYR